MNFYHTYNIFVPSEKRFSWQKQVEDFIFDREGDTNTFAISVPRRYGKTHFAAHWITSHDNSRVIYFNSKTAVKTVKDIYETKTQDQMITVGSGFVDNDESAVLCSKSSALERKLEYSHFDYLLVDDADLLDNATLHGALLKAVLKNTRVIILGTSDYNGPCVENLNKSVWIWLLNHPSISVCIVKKADEKKCFDESKLLEPFENIAYPQNFRLKSAKV